MKRFIIYALRWQLSSPILAATLYFLNPLGFVAATIIANIIGACVFFYVDESIFNKEK